MMRAISLHQPWASLMAVGAKTIETRGRVCHVRGDVAICAAHKIVQVPWREAKIIVNALDQNAQPLKDQDYIDGLPRGVVVAVVEIYECWTTEHLIGLAKPLGYLERQFGDYSAGRFGWATRNLRKLKEPVPVKGAQGFFFLPGDVEAKVRAQL